MSHAQSDEGLPAEYDWRKAIANNQFPAVGAINDFEAVRIGGIDQWISVKGSSPDNPLLLWLHGGPGYPMSAESWTFQRPWEDFFTVVQWDQPGAGKTFATNEGKPDKPLTIDRFQDDAEELIDYLSKRYQKRKVFLLGHSWGTVLGLRIARDRPELLHAYVSVGQVVEMSQGEGASYRITLEKARQDGNAEAIEELEAIAPYPKPGYPVEDIYTERKWATHYGGMIHCLPVDDEVERWRMSPLYDDQDVLATSRSGMTTFAAIWEELKSEDFRSVRSLECPFFLFMGLQDLATPAEVAEKLFDQVKAPEKRYFAYPKAAHYPFMEAPGHFLLDLIQHVRPIADEVLIPVR